MGILADLFVATPDDALAYHDLMLDGAITPDRFDRAEFKGLIDLYFGELWAILNNEPWNFEAHHLEEIYVKDQGEVWLFRFPEPFVARLKSLNAADIPRAAKAWASTEELRAWELADVIPVVRALVRLSMVAERGSNLYLWGSL